SKDTSSTALWPPNRRLNDRTFSICRLLTRCPPATGSISHGRRRLGAGTSDARSIHASTVRRSRRTGGRRRGLLGSAAAGCHNAVLVGVNDRLRTVAESELHQDPRHVGLHRGLSQ